MYDKIFKLSINEHSFLDKIIYKYLTHPVIDYAKKKNYTPNHLTTCSFFFQGLGVIFLAYDYRWNYTFFYMLGYYFDSIDGPMARKYDMVSTLGDWYDHTTDILCFSMANYILIVDYHLLSHTLLLIIYIFQMCGLLLYTGCQEQIYNKYLKNELGQKGENQVSQSLLITTFFINKPAPEIRLQYLKPFCITNSLLFFSLLPHFIVVY
jgi:phosphatidylglycerophosphate synthase